VALKQYPLENLQPHTTAQSLILTGTDSTGKTQQIIIAGKEMDFTTISAYGRQI
jgi:hypothetical protein